MDQKARWLELAAFDFSGVQGDLEGLATWGRLEADRLTVTCGPPRKPSSANLYTEPLEQGAYDLERCAWNPLLVPIPDAPISVWTSLRHSDPSGVQLQPQTHRDTRARMSTDLER